MSQPFYQRCLNTRGCPCAACRDIPPKCAGCVNEACARASWTLSPCATKEEKYYSHCHDCREKDRIAKLR